MKDYMKGKIYTIRCRNDNSLIYVGSTIETLCKRFSVHRGHSKLEQFKHKMLYIEVVKTGWDDWYIELHEYCPSKTLEELLKREGEVTRLIGTLNKNIAGRTMKEYYIDNRTNILNNKSQYYVENKDTINEKMKQYYINNREYISNYKSQYYVDNKDTINEKMKQYYVDNKDTINQKSKTYQKNYKINHPDYHKNYYNNNKEYHKLRYQNMKLLKLNTEQHVEENVILIL